MKKIPERLELSEEDIKAAIELWIKWNHEPDAKFNIVFTVNTKPLTPPPGAPMGGMSDWYTTEITAVAERT